MCPFVLHICLSVCVFFVSLCPYLPITLLLWTVASLLVLALGLISVFACRKSSAIFQKTNTSQFLCRKQPGLDFYSEDNISLCRSITVQLFSYNQFTVASMDRSNFFCIPISSVSIGFELRQELTLQGRGWG